MTTQPSLIATMVAALELTGGERVLEVGTGLGFQTAILALLARQVVSIERLADLAAQARANLAAAGVGGVTVVVGDGTLGVPEHAPYQAIVVSAAAPWVPGPLVEQLADGGRLVHPVGPGGHEDVTCFSRQADRLVVEARLVPARFVPLVGAYGTPARKAGASDDGHGGAGRGHHAGPERRPDPDPDAAASLGRAGGPCRAG